MLIYLKLLKKKIFLQKSVANSDSPTGIVTCWTFQHISNAKIEEFNDKIRWLIKQAYGFRDREYNKIENLSVAGNFKREIIMNFCHKPSMRQKKECFYQKCRLMNALPQGVLNKRN